MAQWHPETEAIVLEHQMALRQLLLRFWVTDQLEGIHPPTPGRADRRTFNGGCHRGNRNSDERELAEHLQSRGQLQRCPIARLLKACGQLGVQVRLPACPAASPSLGKSLTGRLRVVREQSWHGLLGHLRSRALAPGAADQLRADFATVEASWPDICCRLRRRGPGSGSRFPAHASYQP
jgi:hypothetical protein